MKTDYGINKNRLQTKFSVDRIKMITLAATKMIVKHWQGKIYDRGMGPLNVFWVKWLLITFQQHKMEYLSKEQTFYQSRIFPWEALPWEILLWHILICKCRRKMIIRGLGWIVLREEGEEEEIHLSQSKKDCDQKIVNYGFKNTNDKK